MIYNKRKENNEERVESLKTKKDYFFFICNDTIKHNRHFNKINNQKKQSLK